MISHYPQLGVKFVNLLTRDLQDFGHLLPASHETCGDPIHPKRHRDRFWLDLPFKAHPTTKSLDGNFNQPTLFFLVGAIPIWGNTFEHAPGRAPGRSGAGHAFASVLAALAAPRLQRAARPLQRGGPWTCAARRGGGPWGEVRRVAEMT